MIEKKQVTISKKMFKQLSKEKCKQTLKKKKTACKNKRLIFSVI